MNKYWGWWEGGGGGREVEGQSPIPYQVCISYIQFFEGCVDLQRPSKIHASLVTNLVTIDR